jgi:hypothetical protein
MAVKFEGKMEELKGLIYDCADARQANQFTRMTQKRWQSMQQGSSRIDQVICIRQLKPKLSQIDGTNQTRQ